MTNDSNQNVYIIRVLICFAGAGDTAAIAEPHVPSSVVQHHVRTAIDAWQHRFTSQHQPPANTGMYFSKFVEEYVLGDGFVWLQVITKPFQGNQLPHMLATAQGKQVLQGQASKS